ncbi:hypothetical protein B0J17DRAFT_666217 [Rhizoctonia solani]|nr:hypothetical protein B0J17DRAFT_666217 [Rhizoctonia solani]
MMFGILILMSVNAPEMSAWSVPDSILLLQRSGNICLFVFLSIYSSWQLNVFPKAGCRIQVFTIYEWGGYL